MPAYNKYRRVILSLSFRNRNEGPVNDSTVQFNATVNHEYILGDRFVAIFYSPPTDLNPATNTTGSDIVVTVISSNGSSLSAQYEIFTPDITTLTPNNQYIDYAIAKLSNVYQVVFDDPSSYDYIKIAMKYFEA